MRLTGAIGRGLRLPPAARALLPTMPVAVVIGVGSSLTLLCLDEAGNVLERFAWGTLPTWLGVPSYSGGWTLLTLTLVGVAVGVLVWRYPGLSRPDPAMLGLVDAPQPVALLPGIAVAAVLGLGGGVSLGPENPITTINIALAVWLGARISPTVPATAYTALAAAGTVGALFGTPVAAALIMSELSAGADPRPLWDRLFAPLVAAGAGALTTVVVANPSFTVRLPVYPGFRLGDALSAMVISSAAALLGLVAVAAFPLTHRALRRLGHPLPRLVVGGVVLGLLGWLGGRLSLFKGLEQMRELADHASQHSAGNLLLLSLVKLGALVVAASAGFWGGRIFPAVFAGVALGLFAQRVAPFTPVSLAVACAVLGLLLATTRQGWLSLFTAAIIVLDVGLLPVLCVATLPAWLLVTGRPELTLRQERPANT